MVELTANLSTEDDRLALSDEFEYDKIRLVTIAQINFDAVWKRRKGKFQKTSQSIDLPELLQSQMRMPKISKELSSRPTPSLSVQSKTVKQWSTTLQESTMWSQTISRCWRMHLSIS